MIASQRRARWLWSAIVFVISFGVMFIAMRRDLDMYDEGIILSAALRLMDGDTVHHNFYSPYGPASYFILSKVFALTSHDFLAGRVFGIAIMAGIAAIAFRMLLPHVGKGLAALGTVLVVAWMVGSPIYLYPLYPSLLLGLVGSLLIAPEQARPGRTALFLGGATTGLAAWFRYDAGFFLLVAHLAGIFILGFQNRKAAGWFGSAVRSSLVYGVGTAAVFLPFAIAFLLRFPIDSFIADIIDYPLNYYFANRALPFPTLADVIAHPVYASIYLPVVVVVACVVALLLAGKNRGPSNAFDLFLVLTVFTGLLYYKGVVRVTSLHMLMSIIPATLLAVLLYDHWRRRGLLAHAAAAAILGLAAAPPLLTARGLLAETFRDRTSSVGGALAYQAGLIAAKPALLQDCKLPEAITGARQSPAFTLTTNYLTRFTRPDERIFVALRRSDKSFANAVALYFAAQRQPGTHWHHFDPGLQSRADIHALIIADLERNGVRWIVRDGSYENIHEPNASDVSSGSRVLDDFIAGHYRPVAQSGVIEIWLAQDVAAPAIDPGNDCLPAAWQAPSRQ